MRRSRAIGAVVVLLSGGPAVADESIIERCRSAGSDAERIACLEAAILAGAGETDLTSSAPATSTEPEPEPEPQVEQAAEAPGGDDDDIGAEQVAARNRTAEQIAADLRSADDLAVERYETVGYRKLQVHLTNGQVWRQIPGDVQQIRVSVDRSPTVSISESSLGGYRLRLDGIGRTIRVRRVE